MNVAFKTFGCRLNLAESLEMEAAFEAAGHQVVPIPHPDCAIDPAFAPDWIIVRGCSVTARAQRDCEKKIAQLKTRFPKAEILITGCHPDAKPIPTHLAPPALPDSEAPISRQLSRAYLKVQDGCSGKCAFCIVPSFRGTPVSIPFDKAIARAKAYLDAGFREIVITGCNLCLYHNNGKRLAELISALAEIESPGHRIRLGSIEPGICDTALLDAIEAHPNICRFLHLSLQSGSDRILRLMRRPYTIGHVAEFCADARRRFGARLAIGADVITGFPGETEEQFNALGEFAEDMKFERMGCFAYSEEEGTPAASFPEMVEENVREHRKDILEEQQDTRVAELYDGMIDTEMEIVVEGYDKFDQFYKDGLIDKIFTTNLIYNSPELLSREWYCNVNMSKYIALLIETLNYDNSISRLLDPVDRIHKAVEAYKEK